MKGELFKSIHGWMISYTDEGKEKCVSLHYDDVDYIHQLQYTFDNIEARISTNPYVEFEIVEDTKMEGIPVWGKLIKEGK